MATDHEHTSKGLAVLLGMEDMRHIFEPWPSRMNLAVCLRQDGACKMLVFRDEEGTRILPRVRRALGLPLQEIAVFPKIDGVATRKLMFSEEKHLLSLVRNAPEIVEEAADYSINYTYAVDEGIDPVLFLHSTRSKEAKRVRAKSSPAFGPRTGLAKSVEAKRGVKSTRVQPQKETPQTSDLPRFLQKGVGAGIGVAPKPKAPVKKSRICRINDRENGWISIETPGSSGGELVVNNPGRTFVRGDHRVIAVQRSNDGVEVDDMPEKLSIFVGDQPSLMETLLSQNVGLAQVTLDQGFIFLDLKHVPETALDRTAPPTATPVKRRYPRLLASVGVVAITLAFVVQYLLQPWSGDLDEDAINWSRFQLGQQGSDTGLKLGALGGRFRPQDG